MNLFSPSVLKQESAYVVPVLRRSMPSSDLDAKLKLTLLAAVLGLHVLALGTALVLFPAHEQKPESVQLVSELSLNLESGGAPVMQSEPSLVSERAPVSDSVHDPMAIHKPKSVAPTIQKQIPTIMSQPQPSSNAIPNQAKIERNVDHAVVNSGASASVSAAFTTASGGSASNGSANSVTNHLAEGSGNGRGTSATGVGTSSAATCSALNGFNRRYPGVLEKSSTVTLSISRNAQGAVTSASTARSSGNAALDQFALNSARNARFNANADCGQRSFVLPIVFKPN